MTKIKIYRGIVANSQEQLDSYVAEFLAGGVGKTHGGGANLGEGDYFTTSKEEAESYAESEKYSYLFEFEVDKSEFMSLQEAENGQKALSDKLFVEYQALGQLDKLKLDRRAEDKGLSGFDVYKSEHGYLDPAAYSVKNNKLGVYYLSGSPDESDGDYFVIGDRTGFLAAASGRDTPKQVEAKTSTELASYYRSALTDIKAQLSKWLEDYDNLSFSQKLEFEHAMNVENTINSILNEPLDSIDASIKNHVLSQGEDGYYGSWFTLENGYQLNLSLPLLGNDVIEGLISSPVAGGSLSSHLYKNRNELAQGVTEALKRGFTMGYGYQQMASEVSAETEANYAKAMRIARTEGGRISSQTTLQAYEEAEKEGVEIQKRWLATLDLRTRSDHRELDGQTVETNDYFTVNGHKGKAPHLFGIASEDINCRCTTIPVVFGVAPDVRRDQTEKKVIPWENYPDWLKAKKEDSHG